MEEVTKEAQDGLEYLFVSFDIDTLDPGFVSELARPNPAD
jgi:arginase family enzyme